MRILAFLFCLFSLSAYAHESYRCSRKNIELIITVFDRDHLKNVSWNLNLDSSFMTGSGVWQKETDSEDAFSAYDDHSAISYKAKRAVFVFPNNQAIYFSICEIIFSGKKQ